MINYKKTVIVFQITILFVILMLFPVFEAQYIEYFALPENNTTNNDFYHSVLGEYCATTTCPNCPTAGDQMYQIYNMGYNFSYVTLVSNRNPYAGSRGSELEVTAVPSVIFDGNIKIVGRQFDISSYEDALMTSSNRDVADIDLNMYAFWMGDSKIKIKLKIINNEENTYNGHLHVYITEKTSRWNDDDDNPFHFAMIGNYAFNQNVDVDAGVTEIYTKTWKSPYTDITIDNIKVIASVFNYSSQYTDETTDADPELPNTDPPSIPSKPTGISSGNIGVKYNFTTSSTEPNDDEIRYGWDWDGDGSVNDWTKFYQSGQIIQITNTWSSMGEYNVKVKAKDEFGTESEWSEPLTVTMPKNKMYYQMNILFKRFIHRFSFFEKILNQTI
jgi:hypothetical protein